MSQRKGLLITVTRILAVKGYAHGMLSGRTAWPVASENAAQLTVVTRAAFESNGANNAVNPALVP